MDNSLYSYLIHFNGSGAPVLSKKNIQPEPGKRFSASTAKSERTYLTGGFTSFSETNDVPLSPTLQLNGDFGDFSSEKLQNIGLAELNRLNSTNYRSYTLEPDKRVLILARDSENLTRFLETYSSVLKIEPLLIGRFHQEFTTAEDLTVTPLDTGCQVSYLVRRPVNLERCTYCGICGPACPENCLDANLIIDFSRCTYCNECVKLCPEEAIDLYRGEKYKEEYPALLLLDQPKVELPNNLDHIFTSETLESLFSSLIPLQIEETVSWASSSCQYSGRLGTGCTVCFDACKHNAIAQNQDGVAINHKNCVECGACLASCPSGALQYQRFTDRQFIEWFDTVRIEKDCTIIIGNEPELHSLWWRKFIPESDRTVFLEYPNVRALTAMHFLFLLGQGIQQIILLDNPTVCQNKQIALQVSIANTIFGALFGSDDIVIIAESSALKDSLTSVDTSPIQVPYNDFSFINRREKLRSIISFLLEQSSTKDADLSSENYITFGSVSCDPDLCTHCGACINECHIEALSTDENSLTLDHQSILCVQCGTCVEVCPEDALKLKPGLLLSQSFFSHHVLTRAEPIMCLECGKPFGTKKSYERIVAILKEKNPNNINGEVLEYCETCRVVKMFEAHQN